MQDNSNGLSKGDLEFVSSLSRAVLERPTRRSVWILWVVVLAVVWLIFPGQHC